MTEHSSRDGGAWGLLAILVCLYGSAFLLIKITVETISPVSAVAIRIVTATAVLLVACLVMGRRLPPLRGLRHWGMLAILGITGSVAPFILISWGQQTVPSSLAGILMAIMPLTTMVLAAALVPGEAITPRRLAGFTMGFFGLVILFGPTALGLAGRVGVLAQLAILSGACFYALNAVLSKHRPPMDALTAATAIHLCASFMIVPLAFLVEDPMTLEPSQASLAAVTTLGVLCSAFATLVLLRLIDRAGPSFTAQINYLIPLWATGLGIILLGENPGMEALPALILILGGIAVAQDRRKAG
ncbi:MAG: DMT family transporter [Alphaproteobacteria bacterium]